MHDTSELAMAGLASVLRSEFMKEEPHHRRREYDMP